MNPTPQPRLSLLQASQAPVAVIFRCGPSKRVEVIKWDLTHDTFERGHWFHGRIYERRSDLSPDGELLVYFASKFTPQSKSDHDYTYAWTAVSRAPWITALALWPKGDCWHGGGLFSPSDAYGSTIGQKSLSRIRHIVRRDWKSSLTPMPMVRMSRSISGGSNGTGGTFARNGPPNGEDSTAASARSHRMSGSNAVFEVMILSRSYWSDESIISIITSILASKARATTLKLPPGPLEWLDWDPNGRLIALAAGRAGAAPVAGRDVAQFAELIDFRDDRPEPRQPPDSARNW